MQGILRVGYDLGDVLLKPTIDFQKYPQYFHHTTLACQDVVCIPAHSVWADADQFYGDKK